MTKPELLKLIGDALKFYAEPSNYKSPSKGFAAQYDPEPSPIQNDNGKKARDAIEAATLEVKKAQKMKREKA